MFNADEQRNVEECNPNSLVNTKDNSAEPPAAQPAQPAQPRQPSEHSQPSQPSLPSQPVWLRQSQSFVSPRALTAMASCLPSLNFHGRLRELLLAFGCEAARLDDEQSDLARAVTQLQRAVAETCASRPAGATSATCLPAWRVRWWSLCASARVHWELRACAKVDWELRFQTDRWAGDFAEVHDCLFTDIGIQAAARALEMVKETREQAAAKALIVTIRDVVVWQCVRHAGADRQDTFLDTMDAAFDGKLASQKDLTSQLLNSFHHILGTLGGFPGAFRSGNSKRTRRPRKKVRVPSQVISAEPMLVPCLQYVSFVAEPEVSDNEIVYEAGFAKILKKLVRLEEPKPTLPKKEVIP